MSHIQLNVILTSGFPCIVPSSCWCLGVYLLPDCQIVSPIPPSLIMLCYTCPSSFRYVNLVSEILTQLSSCPSFPFSLCHTRVIVQFSCHDDCYISYSKCRLPYVVPIVFCFNSVPHFNDTIMENDSETIITSVINTFR